MSGPKCKLKTIGTGATTAQRLTSAASANGIILDLAIVAIILMLKMGNGVMTIAIAVAVLAKKI